MSLICEQTGEGVISSSFEKCGGSHLNWNRHFCDGHHIPIARSTGNVCAEITEAQRGSTAMSGIDMLGYLAALAVLAAFCMSSIVPLRIVAILKQCVVCSVWLIGPPLSRISAPFYFASDKCFEAGAP
jgi:hypothetical protein